MTRRRPCAAACFSANARPDSVFPPPVGTPAAIVTQLSNQLQTTLATPEVVQRFQQLGAEAKWMGPTEFRQFVQGELTRQTKILKDIGVQPQ